jgi:hypothetical protein
MPFQNYYCNSCKKMWQGVYWSNCEWQNEVDMNASGSTAIQVNIWSKKGNRFFKWNEMEIQFIFLSPYSLHTKSPFSTDQSFPKNPAHSMPAKPSLITLLFTTITSGNVVPFSR